MFMVVVLMIVVFMIVVFMIVVNDHALIRTDSRSQTLDAFMSVGQPQKKSRGKHIYRGYGGNRRIISIVLMVLVVSGLVDSATYAPRGSSVRAGESTGTDRLHRHSHFLIRQSYRTGLS